VLLEYYRGFACPHARLNESFLELVVTAHAKQTVQTFLERYVDELDSNSPGTTALLSAWLSQDGNFDTVWDPAFGGIYAELLDGTGDIALRAATLALRLNECGYSGEWEARLSSSANFRVGRWLLPPATGIRVLATPELITISTDGSLQRELTFLRGETGWEFCGVKVCGIEVLQVSGGNSNWVVLSAELLASWEFAGLRSNLDDKSPHPLVHGCNAAVNVLVENGDSYLSWVTTVLRYLVPWKAEPGQFPSGSSSTNCAPGVIGIGNHGHHLALTDTLVHEASHHYYYILSRLGPVDDGSDSTLYFNPFLELNRPIDRILLAYHAFGNILLLCRTMRTRGLDHPYIVARELYLAPRLTVLEAALQITTALTSLGRALWEPLYDRLHG
jgi:hypothetical protein